MPDLTPSSSRSAAVVTLGWAAFLAVSWTWCIGMFLPVLLVRDYGSWAWVVFALPNVVGAAAMGWVLQRAGSSERMVGRHADAMAAFSVVTMLFHVLFVGWVVLWLGGQNFVLAAAAAAVVAFPLLFGRRLAVTLSVLVLIGSVTAFVVAIAKMDRIPVAPGSDGTLAGLLPLASVCLLGFALCPYLDLTFHRARQALSTYGAVAAFTLGFGALFLTMIVFTLWYVPLVRPPQIGGPDRPGFPTIVAMAIVSHMVAQAGFTFAAHGVEVVRRAKLGAGNGRAGALAGLAFGGAILATALFVRGAGGYQPIYDRLVGGGATATMSGEELGYRLFMAFYGLIAPAYVWIFIVPAKVATSDKGKWATLMVTLLVAGPMYWIGFVDRHAEWMAAGVAAVVFIRPIAMAISARNPRPTDASLTSSR